MLQFCFVLVCFIFIFILFILDCLFVDTLQEAHLASHFAPTGKNPESSRGHVAFVAQVTQVLHGANALKSHFVCVDLGMCLCFVTLRIQYIALCFTFFFWGVVVGLDFF